MHVDVLACKVGAEFDYMSLEMNVGDRKVKIHGARGHSSLAFFIHEPRGDVRWLGYVYCWFQVVFSQ